MGSACMSVRTSLSPRAASRRIMRWPRKPAAPVMVIVMLRSTEIGMRGGAAAAVAEALRWRLVSKWVKRLKSHSLGSLILGSCDFLEFTHLLERSNTQEVHPGQDSIWLSSTNVLRST